MTGKELLNSPKYFTPEGGPYLWTTPLELEIVMAKLEMLYLVTSRLNNNNNNNTFVRRNSPVNN